jgi:hypothetical protein
MPDTPEPWRRLNRRIPNVASVVAPRVATTIDAAPECIEFIQADTAVLRALRKDTLCGRRRAADARSVNPRNPL